MHGKVLGNVVLGIAVGVLLVLDRMNDVAKLHAVCKAQTVIRKK